MDAAALKAMQAPLKDAYREDAAQCRVTLKARGSLDDQSITCKVETGRALAVAGLHPATGGSGMELCSGDMLLEALAACAGVTLKAVATALEFRLGRRRSKSRAISIFAARWASPRTRRSVFAPSGWRFDLDTDEPQERIDALLKLTERYCVVLQTIAGRPELSVTAS